MSFYDVGEDLYAFAAHSGLQPLGQLSEESLAAGAPDASEGLCLVALEKVADRVLVTLPFGYSSEIQEAPKTHGENCVEEAKAGVRRLRYTRPLSLASEALQAAQHLVELRPALPTSRRVPGSLLWCRSVALARGLAAGADGSVAFDCGEGRVRVWSPRDSADGEFPTGSLGVQDASGPLAWILRAGGQVIVAGRPGFPGVEWWKSVLGPKLVKNERVTVVRLASKRRTSRRDRQGLRIQTPVPFHSPVGPPADAAAYEVGSADWAYAVACDKGRVSPRTGAVRLIAPGGRRSTWNLGGEPGALGVPEGAFGTDGAGLLYLDRSDTVVQIHSSRGSKAPEVSMLREWLAEAGVEESSVKVRRIRNSKGDAAPPWRRQRRSSVVVFEDL